MLLSFNNDINSGESAPPYSGTWKNFSLEVGSSPAKVVGYVQRDMKPRLYNT
jgi:hypothetical protein